MSEAATPAAKVPAHVPDALVWEHSYGKYLLELDDPFEAAGRLHEGPGVIWAADASHGNPAWIITQYDLIKEAFSDSEHFSNARGEIVGSVMESDWMLLPVEADPPAHTHYRRILTPYFTPAAINQRAAEVEDLCASLLTKIKNQGQCEFIGDFASILPNSVVVSLLGMPQSMLTQFLDWEEALMRGANNSERMQAAKAIVEYLRGFIAAQRDNPGTELMQAIISGRFEDRALTDAEILGICYLLYVAGLDTVYNTMGWIMKYLTTDHQLQERLRNRPEDIPAAIEEFMRAYGVSTPSRTIVKDFDFHGVTMKRGDTVRLPTALAGRDPRAFDNPHSIDIDRKPQHITFGSGRHACIGNHLARREIRIVIEAFLNEMNNIRIPDGADLRFHTESTIGLDLLPLVWD